MDKTINSRILTPDEVIARVDAETREGIIEGITILSIVFVLVWLYAWLNKRLLGIPQSQTFCDVIWGGLTSAFTLFLAIFAASTIMSRKK